MTGGDMSPQDRCLELGPRALSDAELLAVILGDCRPEDDALAQAKALLDEGNGLRSLLAFEGVPGELGRPGRTANGRAPLVDRAESPPGLGHCARNAR